MSRAPAAHGALAEAELELARAPDVDDAARTEEPATVRELMRDYFDFVWRSLRHLGVPDADVDDAAQQVFLVAANKLARIQPGHERSFLFGTLLRVGSRALRSRRRRREVGDDSDGGEREDPRPAPDELLDLRRAERLLERVLAGMPLELRAAFILFEIEQLPMSEIAETLAIPSGTVASRLRRARELFRKLVAREQLGGAR